MNMFCPYGVFSVCSKHYAENLGKYWGWGRTVCCDEIDAKILLEVEVSFYLRFTAFHKQVTHY